MSKTTKLIFLSLWIIALFGAIYLGVNQGMKYANEGTSIEKNNIYSSPSDTLTIKMIDDELLSGSTNFTQRFSTKKVLDKKDQIKYYSNNIDVAIKLAEGTDAYIKLYKKANGKTQVLARENAKKIEYNYNDSATNLLLNSYFLTDQKNSFRYKTIRITLYVPKNKVLYFDESTRTFLKHIKTIGNIYPRDMPEHYFKMTDAGLECLDCPKLKIEIEDEEAKEVKKEIEKDGVEVSMTKDSLKVEFRDDGEKAEIKLDKNGLEIK